MMGTIFLLRVGSSGQHCQELGHLFDGARANTKRGQRHR